MERLRTLATMEIPQAAPPAAPPAPPPPAGAAACAAPRSVAVRLGLGPLDALLLISDGARWICSFSTETLAPIGAKTMLLDWHHLKRTCADLSGRICRNKAARAQLLRRLYHRLWRGIVPGTIAV